MRKRRNTNLREEITVGKSKTKGGEGRVVPLSNTALRRLKEWRCQFPDATPAHYLFPSERYGLHGSKGAFGGWYGRIITSFCSLAISTM
jgi:integrase